jgi:hypothetical protein
MGADEENNINMKKVFAIVSLNKALLLSIKKELFDYMKRVY